MMLTCTPIGDASGRSRYDPTNTTAIRIAFRAEAARRLNGWKQLVRIALLSHDVFGHSELRAGQNLPVESIKTPAPRQFGWLGPADKLKSFADWLTQAWDNELAAPSWWRGPMKQALHKGLDKAESETRPTEHNYGHITALLDEQIKREVAGIGQATMQAVNRMVGDHVHRRTSPLATYRDVSKAIDKIAGQRLALMANTYVVKGFNRIKLAVYRQAGLTYVGVIPERILRPRSAPGRSSLDALFDRKTRKKTKKLEPDEDELVNWVTAGDDDVCIFCSDLEDSSPFDLDLAESLYPAHPNSFLPGTRVQGNILAALKAFYAGPAVKIETRLGQRLCVTIKHPVVTTLGVLAAGDLREGMQLLSQCWNIGHPILTADQDNDPPLIEQVFNTLRFAGAVSIAPSAEDLHGDACGVHGDIDVVCADRRLLTYLQAAFTKRSCQFILPEANMRSSVMVSGGGHRSLGNRTFSASGSGPGTAALCDDCLSTTLLDALPFEVLRCGAPADCDTVAPKSFNEDTALYSSLIREMFERSPGQVALDQLVDFPGLKRIARRAGLPHFNVAQTKSVEDYLVRQAGFLHDLLDSGPADIARDEIINLQRFNYVGHVYDVQSTVGWILASKIICLQCRCAVEPYFDYGRNSDLDFD